MDPSEKVEQMKTLGLLVMIASSVGGWVGGAATSLFETLHARLSCFGN